MMETLLIGDLCIDHNKSNGESYIGPGGSVYFAANIFYNFGISPTIVSSYGTDFKKIWLENFDIIPPIPTFEKTLVFRNIYQKGYSRKQFVLNTNNAKPIDLESLPPDTLEKSNIVFVAPLLNHYTEEYFLTLNQISTGKLKVLLPQGMFRSEDSYGLVKRVNWNNAQNIIKNFDIIVFSKEDTENSDRLGEYWSSLGPIVVVTKDSEGCSIFSDRKRIDLKAFEIDKICDSTGAGDIFASSFAFAYSKTNNIRISGNFANAAAGLSLRFHSDRLKYKLEDVISFAKEQGVKLEL